jgi:uncharacterized glyoxalase superfamily protein PhnB
MKLQIGIITPQLQSTADFYRKTFNFETKFEAEWFILLHAPGRPEDELALMLPGQKQLRLPEFQRPFAGGAWLILESADIEAEYRRLKAQGAKFVLELTTEEWGDRHFTVLDPAGVAVDVVAERQP